MTRCWCGSVELEPFSPDYIKCKQCETLISNHSPKTNLAHVDSNEQAFYGSEYWFSHQEKDLGQPNVVTRARTDLPERCLHWLRTLLKYKLPPAKVLELGSAHGGFVAMLRLAGFDATGLELSPWIVDFARKTFDVPMLLGPIEDQKIEQGSLDAIALMDVLEHLPDPAATMKHCLNLLKPDGILLIQTPCFPTDRPYEQMKQNDDSFLLQLKENEHLFLFSKQSVKELFNRLGADYIEFEPAIFSHYDMFLAVGRTPLDKHNADDIEQSMISTTNGRFVQALLDLREEMGVLRKKCEISEADRAARLEVVNRLRAQLEEVEADRAARLGVINDLQKRLEESEADRAARLEVINALQKRLEESNADCASRLEVIHLRDKQLAESENDRASSLEVINTLQKMLDELNDEQKVLKDNFLEKSKMLETAENDLQNTCVELDNKDKELAGIKSSLSWKITAPFRWFYDIFRKSRK